MVHTAPTQEECKALWKGNKAYVDYMGDRLDINEAIALSKKQDALYLAWFDGDSSKLGLMTA